jgi:hypothetical protein
MQAPILLAHGDPVAARQIVKAHRELYDPLIDREKDLQHTMEFGCGRG